MSGAPGAGDETLEWLLSLLVGAIVGGGGVLGYLAARGQLDLDRTKHQDELDAPKRLHRLEALKRSVSGVESAVRIYSGLGSRIVRGQ